MTRVVRTISAIFILAALPVAAQAHTGVHPLGLIDSAGAGFVHPFSGLDHLLTMIAVGLWAASLGGRAVWAVPSAFIALMTVGAGFGMAGVTLPWIETGIALSVVVVGLLVAALARVPVMLAAAIVGVFAVFHGQAHGAEMPAMAAPMQYALGFIAATVLLHGIGLAGGLMREGSLSRLVLRGAGVVVAMIGIANAAFLF
jgi:urease accessory protein